MAKKEKESITYDLGCVLYTDGGCRPGYDNDGNHHYGGWGIHGYTYPLGKTPPKLRTKKDVQTTRGYLEGSTVGLEDQVVVDNYVDGYGSIGDKDTNNIAELTGMKRALSYIDEKDIKKAHLLLDSQYVLRGITEYYPKWEALGWKKPDGGYYQNKGLWTDLMGLYNTVKSKVDLSMDWVNGHSGNLGNDRADYLATKGLYLGRNGVIGYEKMEESPNAKYRDPKPEINRLLSKHRLYFNPEHEAPLVSKDGRYMYHCGAHGPDDTLVGKPIADSVACIVYLKEQDKVIEAIRQHHRKLIDDPYFHLCLMRMDTILLPRVYDEIMNDGVNVLSIASRKLRFEGLCTPDEKQVTKIIRPSGLTSKLVDVHNFMDMLFNEYLDGKAVVTDVTDAFFETKKQVVKKKEVEVTVMKLTPDIKSLKLDLIIKGKETFKYPTTLTTGIDYPSRELLNAIAVRNPTVKIVTWLLSDKAYSYATIIECGDDAMIWMGKDCNLQVIFPERIIPTDKG